MISIAFALALAASPAPAPPPAAGACTLLNLGACADAGPLVRDPAFQAALRQFVGRRVTAYLSTGGGAYGEAMTVLGGPADPVRRLRNLYLFTACADAACGDQGAVVLQPDGELAAVAILHSDCNELRRVGDCVSREVLSVLRGPDDDLGVVDDLSGWAQRGLAARPLTPGQPIRSLDRVEVIALAGPEAQTAGPIRTAPPIALPRNPTPAPLPAPPPPAVALIRPLPAAPSAPVVRAPDARPAPSAQPAAPPPPALAAAKPEPASPEPERASAAPEAVTSVSEVAAVAPPRAPLILTPMKVYLTLVRTEPEVVIVPPPPPPPKPPKTGWQWHSTPYDCRRPRPGHLAVAGVGLDPLAATCSRWNDEKPK